MDWKDYFKKLSDWKKFPAYRFELRLDSLIGYYLPEIVGDYKKKEIIGVIPEFLINGKDSYFYVDFLLISNEKTNYLVEFKTDMKSRNKKQDEKLLKVKDKKFETLINEIVSLYFLASKNKRKHNYFIDKLKKEYNLINDNYEFIGMKNDIEIIFVQPLKEAENPEYTVIDFKEVSEWISNKKIDDPFEKELCNILLKIKEEEEEYLKNRKGGNFA
jgi:hypothetical protein